MLALHGFDVFGLEISSIGGKTAEAYVEKELADPHEYNFASSDAAPRNGIGKVEIIVGDFFDRLWEQNTVDDGTTGFDLITALQFLCALPAMLRKDWARRMSELLTPQGVLVCLEFPLYKGADEPGPPWPLKGVYWNLLAEGGDGTPKEAEAATRSSNGMFVRVAYFKPPRSHSNGRGTDMLSVWRRKD